MSFSTRSHWLITLLAFVLAVPAARAQTLVSHWCFEERQGSVAADRVGNNDAELIDMDPLTAWVPGEAGLSALRFDGEDDFLLVQDSEFYDLAADFTWAAYVRTDNPNAGGIIAKSPTEDDWTMGAIALFIREGLVGFDVGYIDVVDAVFPIGDGEWHLVTMTVEFNITDDGLDRVQIYVDGFQGAVKEDWDIEEFGAPPGDFKIGFASPDFPEEGSHFDGLIDDVKVWQGALTPEQVEISLDQVGEDCELNPPVCDDPADTHCNEITRGGPDGGVAGLYTFTVNATDDGGDDVFFEFTFDNGIDEPTTVTSTENEIERRLRPGTWTVSVTVDDDPWCDDAAADATCSTGPFEVLPIPPQLVAHYCMEERSGAVVSDATGGTEGVLVGLDGEEIVEVEFPDGVWAPGCVGSAGINPGQNESFVVIEDPAERIVLSDSFTIVATIRTDEESAGTIFSQGTLEDVEPGEHHFFVEEGLLIYDVGELGFLESTAFVADGECHHVAIVVERDVLDEFDTMQFYVDAIPDASSSAFDLQAFGDEIEGGKRIGMGSIYFPDEPLFRGVIDNVKIWNFALTQEDIELDFEAENEGCPSEPPVCPAAGSEEDGDSSCSEILVSGPGGDLEGVWEIEVIAEDATDDELFFTIELLGTNEAGEPEEITLTQFAEPFFEVGLDPGDWSVSATVDDDLFCDDESAGATCDAVQFTVVAIPDELVASFCFEDDEPDFTEDVVSFLGADLVVFPEDVGDGEPPVREEGVLDSGNALRFDGVDDAMVIEPHPAMDVRKSYTIAATILAGEDPDGRGPDPNAGSIWILGPEIDDSGDQPGVQNLFVHEGAVRFTVLFVGEMPIGAAAPVNDGEPHRVLLSVDADFEGELDAARLYIDGALASEWEDDFQGGGLFFDGPNETRMRVGFSAFDWPSADFEPSNDRDINHFNGWIDDVKFWSYALSEEEALDDFDEPGANCEPSGAPFQRGDSNGDGAVNISDPSYNLNFLFLGGPEPPCLAAADTNGDGDVNISDPSYNLNFLFLGGPQPDEPFPDCGLGTEMDLELGCEEVSLACQ